MRRLFPVWSKHVGSEEADVIISLFEKHQDRKMTSLLLRELECLVEKMASVFSHIYLALDGIDEITERRQILSLAEQFPCSGKWSLLISSRYMLVIEKALSGALRLNIDLNMIYDDIQHYIRHRLQCDLNLGSIKSLLKQEIGDKLPKQSDGMYIRL